MFKHAETTTAAAAAAATTNKQQQQIKHYHWISKMAATELYLGSSSYNVHIHYLCTFRFLLSNLHNIVDFP